MPRSISAAQIETAISGALRVFRAFIKELDQVADPHTAAGARRVAEVAEAIGGPLVSALREAEEAAEAAQAGDVAEVAEEVGDVIEAVQDVVEAGRGAAKRVRWRPGASGRR
jgi:hypothetical protein